MRSRIKFSVECMSEQDIGRISGHADVADMRDADLELRLGIEIALDEQREAPWYLPWGIALQRFFRSTQRGPHITTTAEISAQFPISAEYEIEDDDEDEGGQDNESDDDNTEDEDGEDTNVDKNKGGSEALGIAGFRRRAIRPAVVHRREETPSSSSDELDFIGPDSPLSACDSKAHDATHTVSASGISNVGTASPDELGGYGVPSDQSDRSAHSDVLPRFRSTTVTSNAPGLSAGLIVFSSLRSQIFKAMTPQPVADGVTPLDTPNSSGFRDVDFDDLLVAALKQAARRKSTRSPDFIRVVCALSAGKTTRFDLIVEIKRKFHSALDRKWQKLEQQIRQQSQHAFTQDQNLMVVGCITAIGPWWKYFEIQRSEIDIDIHPDKSWNGSTSNRSSVPPQSHFNPSDTSARLDEIFAETKQPLNLAKVESLEGLSLISERLKELNPKLWPTKSELDDEDEGDTGPRPSRGSDEQESEIEHQDAENGDNEDSEEEWESNTNSDYTSEDDDDDDSEFDPDDDEENESE